MSPSVVHVQLDAYLSIREALGFQMRAEHTLLRDFVNFVESHGVGGVFPFFRSGFEQSPV